MKKLFLFVFLLLLLFNNKIYSIDTAAVKYYPLAVGNSWTYTFLNYPSGPYYRHTERVTGTITFNNHFYYIITTYRNGYSPANYYCRIDSVNNNIHIYDNNSPCPWLQNETTGDSLGARLRDSSKLYCGNYFILTDTASYSVFGTLRKGKIFSYSAFEIGVNRRFAKDIGLEFSHTSAAFGSITDDLIGCIVNGVLYGDTNLVGVNLIASEVPKTFSLSQNYPNPFNPNTIIKFEVPLNKGGNRGLSVKLIVYNALGKEVTTLVNEQLKPGTYEASFVGTNFPSGVYYYKLETSDYTKTKKMVLIK